MNVFHWTVIYWFWAIVSIQEATGQTVLCGHPGAPANGTFTPTGATFPLNAKVRFQCNDGFILFGNEDRSCQPNGTWTGEIPYCDLNMSRGKSATQSGVYQQQRAWLAIDSKISTCASTQKTPSERWWQLNLGDAIHVAMVAVTIGSGVEADFSVYVVATRGGDDTIVYNRCGNFSGVFEYSMVEIQCNNGSGIIGQYVFIRDNRRGAFHFSLCEVEVFSVRDDRPCGQPERPLQSTVQPFNRTVVQYGCRQGFQLTDVSPFLNCIDGMWESPPPRCVDAYCQAPRPLSYAKFTPGGYAEWFPNPNRTNYPYGTILNYTCNKDHVQAVQGSLVCGDNDTWIGTWPVCMPTSCGPPPIFDNATVFFVNGSTHTAIGAIVELRCHEGLLLSDGEVLSHCMVNGSWSNITATCDEIADDLSYQQPGLGIILSLVVILIVVCLAVFGMLYLRHRGYLTGTLTKRDHLTFTSDDSDITTRDMNSSISKITNHTAVDGLANRLGNGIDNSDVLYDDVWPSEEALVGDGDIKEGLYTDAASSCEDLVLSGTDRIYDRPDGGEADDEHVYYSPLEGLNEGVIINGDMQRSHLPPADGAAAFSASINSLNVSNNSDHIYEPLRQSNTLEHSLPKKKPVYAQVDMALKKHRRSNDDGQPPEAGPINNQLEARQQPEGIVTYTVPSFGNTDSLEGVTNHLPLPLVAIQRPLPPIPNPKLSGQSHTVTSMVDNALYGQDPRKSWALVADNELYDGVTNEVPQFMTSPT